MNKSQHNTLIIQQSHFISIVFNTFKKIDLYYNIHKKILFVLLIINEEKNSVQKIFVVKLINKKIQTKVIMSLKERNLKCYDIFLIL